MLEDREYMREPAYRGRWSLTIWLVIANTAAFVVQNVAYLVFRHSPTDAYFALSLAGLKAGFVWQLLTFQFMHGGLWHLILNCFAIYMFGREVEESLGKRSFLTLYFSSGVMGGLFQVLGALALPTRFGGEVVGASAGAFGLVAAYATLYPERPLTLLLFFILPITMRARFLLLISGLLALFGLVFPFDNVAHAAHLGGMLTGIIFVRWAGQWNWPVLRQPFRRQVRPVLVTTRAQKVAPWRPPRAAPVEDLPPDEFVSKEVDPILDKISAHGIHSLTERERQILEAARKKMAKR
jgi:membrane associated rhomboid family serine protease